MDKAKILFLKNSDGLVLAASRYNTQHGGLAIPLLATVENRTLREKVKNKKRKFLPL